MDGFIGEVRAWAGSYAPRNWLFCQGQILPIQSNTALFSILGVNYGGDGKSYFGLPDLRGRMPIGAGAGPGLSNRNLGDHQGVELVAITQNQMPAHKHDASLTFTPNCNSGTPNDGSPAPNVYADSSNVGSLFHEEADDRMAGSAINVTVSSTGGNQPHENMPPFMATNFIICTQGIYPPRP